MSDEPIEDKEVSADEEEALESSEELEEEYALEDDGEEPESSSRIPLRTKISAVLFAAVKPLSTEKIAQIVRAQPERVEHALEELQGVYRDEDHGFSLQIVGGKWHLRTAPAVGFVIRRLIPPRARRLSRAAAETLAVIAYKQPVQRAEVESIRGVDALPTLKTLLDAKLIRIVGHDDSVGKPALYGTTEHFLEKFGLNDLSDLPSLRELEALEEDPGESVADEEELPLEMVEEAALVEDVPNNPEALH